MMAKASEYATPGDRHAPRSRAACDSEHQADCIVLTVGVRSPMSRISTCEACFSVPRLVPFSDGSRPRSDPEALAGCCRVSLILLHRGVAVVARWARFSWCFPTTALLPSPHPAGSTPPPPPPSIIICDDRSRRRDAGPMSSHRSSSGDGTVSDDSQLPPPTPAERCVLARAGEQAILARIQRFVQDAGARGLRVQGITIAPAPQGRRADDEREPAIVVGEDTSPGCCVVTVEPPVVATSSTSDQADGMPVVAPSGTPKTPSQ